MDEFPRNLLPVSVAIYWHAIYVVMSVYSVDVRVSRIHLLQSSTNSMPCSIARLLASVNMVCTVNSPDVAVPASRYVFEASWNANPTTSSVYMPLVDVVVSVDSPNFVVACINLH